MTHLVAIGREHIGAHGAQVGTCQPAHPRRATRGRADPTASVPFASKTAPGSGPPPGRTPDGPTALLPARHDQPPVSLAAAAIAFHFGHGSSSFGHATIVTRAARGGSADAHA